MEYLANLFSVAQEVERVGNALERLVARKGAAHETYFIEQAMCGLVMVQGPCHGRYYSASDAMHPRPSITPW
jgi:hypothetical protein